MRCFVLVKPLDGSISMSKCLACVFWFVCSHFMMRVCVTLLSLWTTSVSCVMGCSATMATGVSQVLHVDFLCSDRSVRFLVTHSLYCANSWKTGWESDRKRVSGRLCWPQAQRDSIIWSAWVGEGCVPGPSVISERNSMFETLPPTHTLHRTPLFNISDRSETSVELSWWVHPYFTRVSWRIINAPLEWSGDYEDFFLCLFLSCKICFILIFLTVLCFCVYLIIKC